MVVALLVLVLLLGLAVGSFLNVVIHRVPRGESVVSPASRCPRCGRPIRARHNIPVLGWLILRGRCAYCGTPISARYPLVELGTGVLFAALTWRLDRLDRLPAVPAYLCFAAIGIALALIDLELQKLPSAIVLPSYPVLAVLLTGAAAWQHDWLPLARAGLGGAAMLGLYLLLALIAPARRSWDDVKLAGLLGGVLAYLSWSALVIGGLISFVLAIADRATRKTALPSATVMVAAVLTILLTNVSL
ncbi:prepilin peptidase [Kribbella sp. NPDC006257]|uniref:prepilin peptidase n=1 Tax=Kribbella sp. NPDC006257 TaxID=3156738 RepID=UPI0033BFAA93